MNLFPAPSHPSALLFFCLPALLLLVACAAASPPAQGSGSASGTLTIHNAQTTPAISQQAGAQASTNATGASPAGSDAAQGTKAKVAANAARAEADMPGAPLQLSPGKQIDFRTNVAPCWLPLVRRLQADDMGGPLVPHYFSGLAEYSPAPMGTKVKELFANAFVRKPPPPSSDGTVPQPKMRIYRNVVTLATLEKCRAFMVEQKKSLAEVAQKYPVPTEVIVALLFVETRLGTHIGKENAFWSLACMAAADAPERVSGGITDLSLTEEHSAWLQNKLTDKSNWAYKELKALLTYCSMQNIDPLAIPGSVYGAIGLCQFMPSNLIPYGDDGDGDGVVNVFSEADAIFSVARYLAAHGWKAGLPVDGQRSVLKRYNNLTIYANTILALAESLRTGVLQTAPPDAPPAPAKAAGKKAAAKAAGKKTAAKATRKPGAGASAKAPSKAAAKKAAPPAGKTAPVRPAAPAQTTPKPTR